MSKNKDNFRRYLIKENVQFEDVPHEGGHAIKILHSINGHSVVLGVLFNKEDDIVDIKIYNIAKIENPLKKEFLYSLLNELNDSYRFIKFVEIEDSVTSSYSMQLIGNINYSELIFEHLVMMNECIKDEFPKFMKLQWA